MRMAAKTFSAQGIVLKRSDSGEQDRVVHILTKERGKIICMAKGVRRLTSSRASSLEPGNLVSAFFVETKSWPLLTQNKLLQDCSTMPHTLQAFRQLSQLLEILDQLFVEEEIETSVFNIIVHLRKQVTRPTVSTQKVRTLLAELIMALGFPHPNTQPTLSISEYVAQLTERKLKSYEYLKVPGS